MGALVRQVQLTAFGVPHDRAALAHALHEGRRGEILVTPNGPLAWTPTRLRPKDTMDSSLATLWAPRMLAILRIVAGLLFLEHGTQKLFGFPPSEHPSPALLSLMGVAGILETAGGVMLVLGLFTRPVAFVLAGMMAVAYWIAHAPQSFFPALNGGDAAILFCFVFLYLCVAGPGAWSLDGLSGKT
jgi:putative oxidoreductase